MYFLPSTLKNGIGFVVVCAMFLVTSKFQVVVSLGNIIMTLQY